jgi:ATP-dependent helicase/nuclease subunit B
MNTFLQECSLQLITRHGSDLGRVLVVLPAQRPVAYMKKVLGAQIPSPFILPTFTTINELIERMCPYAIVSPVESIFRFYEVYQEMEKDKAEDFRKYFHWATTLMGDFNEVDRYLIEPDQIFRDLRNIKEIENWSFNSTELSAGQKSLLQTWDKISSYYKALHQHLLQQHLSTGGYAYRYVAENIETLSQALPYDKIYFIGFNELSAA